MSKEEALSNIRLALRKLYVVETNLDFVRDKRIPKIKKLLREVRELLSSTREAIVGEHDTSLDKF